MLIIAASQMGASVARAEAEQRAAAPDFDIAPFALPNCPPGEIRFEEPRDIQRVAIVFKGAPSDVGLQYLQHHWPQLGPEWAPIERYRFLDRPFYFGWYPLDDHYQLERRHVEPETTSWRNAAVETAAKGTTVMLTFKPLTAEVPEAAKERYEVTFRRTLALRLVVADLSQIESVRVFTASRPTTSRLRVTFDAGSRTPGDTVALSAYNADIESVQARSGVSVKGGTVKLSEAKERSFELAASHMLPSHTYCFDDGHVKFDLADDAFTISLESLRKQGPIWFPEAGAFITLADDPTTFTEYRKRHEDERTISEMVADHEEQSFARARAEQPRNSLDRVSYCFGVKYRSTGISPSGLRRLALGSVQRGKKGRGS